MILTTIVRGDEDVIDRLEDLGKRARDMKPATRAARTIMRAEIAKNAESQGATFGSPWPLNAPSTVEQKGHARTLEGETGALMAALKGGRGKRGSATKKGAMAGINVFYGRFHQAPASHLPERRIVGISPTGRRQVVRVVTRYYERGIL